MAATIATLGQDGVCRDVGKVLDYICCCFFFTQASQGTLFRNLTSLPHLIQQFGNDEATIRTEVKGALDSLLRRYFTTVSVDVRSLDTGDDDGISLQINAIVSDTTDLENNGVSLGYSLVTEDSQLKRIVRVNNGDVLYST